MTDGGPLKTDPGEEAPGDDLKGGVYADDQSMELYNMENGYKKRREYEND